MASCSEQFLKVSLNSVQRSKRSSGLEIGTNERTNERTDIRITIYPPNFVCGGYNKTELKVYLLLWLEMWLNILFCLLY